MQETKQQIKVKKNTLATSNTGRNSNYKEQKRKVKQSQSYRVTV